MIFLLIIVCLVKLYKNLLYFISYKNYCNSNGNISAINFKRGFGLGDVNRKKLSSFAECWKGIGIIIGIWSVIYFGIAVATGNIM
jgi:hypothetical protein